MKKRISSRKRKLNDILSRYTTRKRAVQLHGWSMWRTAKPRPPLDTRAKRCARTRGFSSTLSSPPRRGSRSKDGFGCSSTERTGARERERTVRSRAIREAFPDVEPRDRRVPTVHRHPFLRHCADASLLGRLGQDSECLAQGPCVFGVEKANPDDPMVTGVRHVPRGSFADSSDNEIRLCYDISHVPVGPTGEMHLDGLAILSPE